MAHLVGQGKGAVQGVLVVEQDKGMDGAADGVGAGALALVLVNVHPAVLKALSQHRAVLLSQHGGSRQDLLLGLVKGNLLIRLGEHIGIEVVHMQLIQAHDLLAQVHIPVHLVHVLVDGLDEVVVHRLRHLHGAQGALEGAVVLPGPGEEEALADLGVEHGGQGIAGAVIDAVEGVEGILPEGAVTALHEGDVGTIGQGMAAALLVRHGGELHVRVVIGVENIAGAAAHLAGGSQQVFLRRRKGVILVQPGLVQIAAEFLQLRLGGVKAVQGFLGNGHQLRALKGTGAAELDNKAEAAALHGLVGGVGGILIVFNKCVDKQLLHLAVDLLHTAEVAVQGVGRLPQLALIGGDLLRQRLGSLQGRAPRLVVSIEIRCVPAEPGIHLAALQDLHILCHNVPPMSEYKSRGPSAPAGRRAGGFAVSIPYFPLSGNPFPWQRKGLSPFPAPPDLPLSTAAFPAAGVP